jgi:hypothetical protein
MTHHRLLRTAALGLALAAVAAPAASAQPSDLAPVVTHSARHVAPPTKAVDFRSPDARDAARGFSYHAPHIARSVVIRGPVYASSAPNSSGTDWGNAAIVSGSAFALIVIGLGTVLITRRKTAARKYRASVLSH